MVGQCATNLDPASNPNRRPTRAIRLEDGDTPVGDPFNHRVIRVDHATPAHVVASTGNLDEPGFFTESARQGLNGPCDAKVKGDFTGLTPPSGRDFDRSGRPAPAGRRLRPP